MSKSYLYNIDNFNYKVDTLEIRGWIFNVNRKITSLKLIIIIGKEEYSINILNISKERRDVYDIYQNENALNSGFFSKIKIENVNNAFIYLEVDGEERILINKIKSSLAEKISFYKKKLTKQNIKKIVMLIKKNNMSKLSKVVKKVVIESVYQDFESIDFIKFKKENFIEKIEYSSELYKYHIDIILPVYNGYEYLEKLFSTIVKTKMSYRLIAINDKSSDPRVAEVLNYYANYNDKIVLIENDNNLGFVKTVNKGFALAKNHIALINTDIELPDMWLERLMLPIICNNDIASSTPFTNSGTICSFPNFCKDNEIFESLDVDYIDKFFQCIRHCYTNIPTGIGFCMGINKNVLDKIGFFDADKFGKGYCEENDWCQRAIKAGYKNVHVENLYVYHKHGGSFFSEEKKKLLERNIILLSEKHPNYTSDIDYFCSVDPVKNIRNYLIFKILYTKAESILVYFDHNIGGGATGYLEKEVDKNIFYVHNVIIIRYDKIRNMYIFNYKYKSYNIEYCFMEFDDIINILNELKIKNIYINELVTYPNIYDILGKLAELKNEKNISITMFLHDFFSICPTINLLDDKGCYCNIPNIVKCEKCMKNNELNTFFNYESMKKWRENWAVFLNQCDNIISFSDSSKMLLQKSYGLFPNISVIPHYVDYILPLNREYKSTNSLNIGLIGTLSYHKGINIVKQMLKLIEKLDLDINIILIGSTVETIKHKNFKQTGKYSTDIISKLVIGNDIDLFFIASIWPETFSYTTQEVINMDLPIVSFDLGAQGERIKKYSKGMVIDNFDAKNVLFSIIEFSKSFNLK